MKIRINENSVRWRLSQTEIKTLVHEGVIKSSCCFHSQNLDYSVQSYEGTEMTADFLQNVIQLNLPKTFTKNWDTDSRIGFETTLENGLYLLIEKDFQCLKPRTHEDESDLFTNPQSIVD